MNDRPNFFVEKIWQSLFETFPGKEMGDSYSDFLLQHTDRFGNEWDGTGLEDLRPKHHSVRRDVHCRWHAGLPIHFVVNNRTANRFQFAPTLTCRLVQPISFDPADRSVTVDGRKLSVAEAEQFALNDGFDSTAALFTWFTKKVNGVLIHWTDLRY